MNSLLSILVIVVVAVIVFKLLSLIVTGTILTALGLVIFLAAAVACIRALQGDRII